MKKHILFTLIGIAYIAVTSAIASRMVGGNPYEYASPLAIGLTFLQELGLVLMIVFYIQRYASWRKVGYGGTSLLRLLWIAPLLVPALIMAWNFILALGAAKPSGAVVAALVVVAAVDLMVGFAEDTLFRGILLRGEMEYRNVFLAMLVSAIGFSLFHLTNLLIAPPDMVFGQLGAALMVGLCLAPLALLVGDLKPLVIWHLIWDFVGEAPSVIPGLTMTNPIVGILKGGMPVIEMVMLVVGWVAVYVLWRKGHFRTESPEVMSAS